MAAPASSGSSNKLTLWILLALVLGAIAGYAIHKQVEDPTPWVTNFGLVTTIFLRLIKMIIAPLVFATLTVGIAKMGDMAVVGRLGLKAMLWFIAASLMSLGLGLLLVNLFQPGIGLNLPLPDVNASSGIAASSMSLADFITHLIPMSIADGMARNEILQIVVFSIFFGIGCAGVGDKAKVLVDALEGLSYVMLKVTMLVMWFAPFAVFAAVAAAIAKSGPGMFETYAFFMGEFYLGIVILWLLLFVAAFVVLGPRAGALFKAVREPTMLAFATASSEAAYPKTLAQLEKVRLQQPRRLVRAAARLFVQPRRLDDVLHLRGDVHRPGLWHRDERRQPDHHAADPDGHLEGHGRRAARVAGGDRRDAVAVQHSGSWLAAAARHRPLPRHGAFGHQRHRQLGRDRSGVKVGRPVAQRSGSGRGTR